MSLAAVVKNLLCHLALNWVVKMRLNGFIFLLCFCVPPALGGPHQEGPAAQNTPEVLPNIEFRTDVRVFTVMAALNAAGFDYETPGKQMSPLRQTLRRELERLDPTLLERMKTFYQTHRFAGEADDEQSPYVSLALLLSAPPDFRLTSKAEEVPADAWHVRGFVSLLTEFYEKAGIDSLWEKYQPVHAAELDAYRPVFIQVISQTLEYFRTGVRIALDRKAILIPDLLNAKNIVNARNLEHTYYIVAGPTDDPAANYRQLQHEYLHVLVDPLIDKFGAILLKNHDLLTMAQNQPRLKGQYQNNYLLIVTESLIESLLLRLHPPEDLDSELVRLFREGFVLAPYFYRRIEQYEANELLSFPVYAETLFQGIRESEIKADRDTIAEAEKKIKERQADERQAEQKMVEEQARREKIGMLLREAGSLLREGNYSVAEEKLQQLLREDPQNGNAHFYLGQAAFQTHKYEEAFQYYEKAAGLPNTADWVRALCWVRMGRYLASQGRFDLARTHFDRVLKMEGDLRGAREAARESLQQLPANW